jgi:hypothetical protein
MPAFRDASAMKRFSVRLGFVGLLGAAVSVSADAKRPERLDADIANFVRSERAAMSSPDSAFDRQLETEDPARVAVARLKSGSGSPLVIIRVTGRMWCGANGMCTTMVLKPRGNSFDILYADSARAPIRLLPTYTRGYPDLSVVLHEDWQTNYDVRLRFDGRHYVYADKVGGYDGGRKLKRHANNRVLIGNKPGIRLAP